MISKDIGGGKERLFRWSCSCLFLSSQWFQVWLQPNVSNSAQISPNLYRMELSRATVLLITCLRRRLCEVVPAILYPLKDVFELFDLIAVAAVFVVPARSSYYAVYSSLLDLCAVLLLWHHGMLLCYTGSRTDEEQSINHTDSTWIEGL